MDMKRGVFLDRAKKLCYLGTMLSERIQHQWQGCVVHGEDVENYPDLDKEGRRSEVKREYVCDMCEEWIADRTVLADRDENITMDL